MITCAIVFRLKGLLKNNCCLFAPDPEYEMKLQRNRHSTVAPYEGCFLLDFLAEAFHVVDSGLQPCIQPPATV